MDKIALLDECVQYASDITDLIIQDVPPKDLLIKRTKEFSNLLDKELKSERKKYT